jgi:hypothetical protein
MTKQPQINSKKQLKPTKYYPMTNNVNYTILMVTQVLIPMHNFQAIHLRAFKASVALGAMTVHFTFIRQAVKRLTLRNCLRHSSAWVGVVDEGETEDLAKDPICKCMFV